jgi:hypothetical protein
MARYDDTARKETLARLAESRAEIRRVLEPPPPPEPLPDGTMPSPSSRGFPRSRTMKLLMSGRGLGTVGAVLGGLLLARPALALRLLRVIPTGAVARMLVVKAVTAMRSRPQ